MYTEIQAKIHKETPQGTWLVVLAEGLSLTDQLRRYSENGIMPGEIRLDDGRTISAKQRKKVWAMLTDISLWNGEYKDDNHAELKEIFKSETGTDDFSLSNCSITTAREYISFLIDFALKWDVPLNDTPINRTEDIGKYLYSCLMHKRCCVCGKDAELHHVDVVGIGNNRNIINHIGLEVMALCREHHTEVGMLGQTEFNEKWHVYGIKADKEICKVYRLNIKEDVVYG